MTNGTPAALPPLFGSSHLETGLVGPYQETDRRIIDYQQVMLAGHAFRGPLPARLYSKELIGFIGAAQTFGRFARVPFPTLVGSMLSRDVLNLGYAGAGPDFYLNNKVLLSLLSNCKVVVVQVMSGRSVSNSVFESLMGRNVLRRRFDNKRMTDGPAYEWYRKEKGGEAALDLVRETQENWVKSMIQLAHAIQTKTILFWFSERSTDFEPKGGSFQELMGEFPHLVSTEMIERVMGHFDAYATCVSQRGLPQPLIDRHTGEPVEVYFAGASRARNIYYPSPSMHVDAAMSLEDPLKALL